MGRIWPSVRLAQDRSGETAVRPVIRGVIPISIRLVAPPTIDGLAVFQPNNRKIEVRIPPLFILTAIFFSTAALAANETRVTAVQNPPPRLTVQLLKTPVPPKKDAPIIDSVSARLNVPGNNGVMQDIVPDYHFIA